MNLIGAVDIDSLAQELYAHGFSSCQAAERDGWLLTQEGEIRQAIDRMLDWWNLRQ